MNIWNGIGRTTTDIELRYTQGDQSIAVASFTLAVERRFKHDNQATADFIRCKAFGKTAETLEKYVRKGTKIGVTGEIRTGSYTNNDGIKVYTTDILVGAFDFCEKKSDQNAAPVDPNSFVPVPDDINEELPFN